jgi:hypothetical protein
MSLTSYQQFYKKWFSTSTPVPGVKASINIGSGDNGIVTIHADLVGTEGNDYTITVSTSGADDCDMSVSISEKDITVVLGKTGNTLEATKNTAELVAAAINALDGINAVYSGTGADSLTQAVSKTNFTGGQYATPVSCPAFIIINGTWYIADAPVTKYTVGGWKSATPA